MLLFLLFFAGVELLVLICSFFRSPNKYWPVFAVLAAFVGFRNYGGVDDINFSNLQAGGYINSFYLFKRIGDQIFSYSSWESSYYFFCKLALSLHMSYKAVFLIYAVLTYFFLYLAFRVLCKTRTEWLLAIGSYQCFCLITGLSLMRQSLAMAMILYAVTLIMSLKWKKAFIIWLLACVIHNAALFAIIIFILFSPKVKIHRLAKALVPPVCYLLGVSGAVNAVILQLSWIFPAKYQIYLNNYKLNQFGVTQSAGLLSAVFFIIYLMQLVLGYNSSRKGDGEEPSKYLRQQTVHAEVAVTGNCTDILERGEGLYLSLYFVALSSGAATRVSILFIVFTAFLLNTFLSHFPKADKQVLGIVMMALLVIYYVYELSVLPQNIAQMIYPYHWSTNLFADFIR